ncbi:cyclophilin type peptidyl-prolyl cis-trans isomerase, putative [Leishmania tarentolae]|uniref:Cyclophilin type peptidyl-prolyl cis-trans isomerase, putative n=1 Tax=Leishmania tarentolae TaxID=5689 RepID=A0A640K6V2_LEITA|nr:cyclophilin type peptidyl-prolyl cis-trans isomerase, putative [Leishmania tarentolae]
MTSATSFTVYGLVTVVDFQRCAEAAAYVNDNYPESYAVAVKLEVPRDFSERRAAWASARRLPSQQQPTDTSFGECGGLATTRSAAAGAPDTVLVEQHGGGSDPQRLLTAEMFLHHITTHTNYKPNATEDYYSAQGERAWRAFLASRDRQYCWMDVSVDDVVAGRIWFELYTSVAPLTCKNFCELCRGTTVATSQTIAPHPESNVPPAPHIGYKGTTFFRTLKDAWVMGGDVTGAHTGNGGYSCYGRCFPDETYAVPHDAAGVLGMCNDGPHTNSSSFYITLRTMSWMDGKYVAFGRVIDGMQVVDAIHAVEVRHNQAPKASIVITDCDVLDLTL